MNAKHKFVYLKSCGCVLSERCLREVPSDLCHKCQKPFTDADVVAINPSAEETAVLRAALEKRRKTEKQKKSKHKESADGAKSKPAPGSPVAGAKRKADEGMVSVGPALDPAFDAQLRERMAQIKSHSAMKRMFTDGSQEVKDDRNFMSRTAFRQSFY